MALICSNQVTELSNQGRLPFYTGDITRKNQLVQMERKSKTGFGFQCERSALGLVWPQMEQKILFPIAKSGFLPC